jgi:hypothetical protein
MPSPMYQQYQQPQGNNIFNMFMQFRQNPMAMLSQRYNIPQNLNNPNDILQYLLNTNQVSQQQVNNAVQMANSPQIRQMFGGQ